MPPRSPRPTIPPDDLYARLEIASTASPEVIEVAWRSLLRRHHPDVAGPDGLERAKRINVAHDWLSDPDLRARYDRERGIARARVRDDRWSPRSGPDRPGGQDVPTPRHRGTDPAEALARFLDRVSNLDEDDLDRLACAEVAPIAFGATIARFLPPDRLAALEAMEAAVGERLDHAAARRPGIRDAVEGYGTELVLGPFLDEHLTDPFRERARERLTRGWEAAVGQPRYGPNGVAIRAFIARVSHLDAEGVAGLAAAGQPPRGRTQPVDDPWPPGTSREDDEALRVSSVLAARDAAAAVPAVGGSAMVERARRSAARLAHLLVFRHAFAAPTFAALVAPWRPRYLPDDAAGPRVRRPAAP